MSVRKYLKERGWRSTPVILGDRYTPLQLWIDPMTGEMYGRDRAFIVARDRDARALEERDRGAA